MKVILSTVGFLLSLTIFNTSIFANHPTVANFTAEDFKEFGAIEICSDFNCWKIVVQGDQSVIFTPDTIDLDSGFEVKSDSSPVISLPEHIYNAIEAKWIPTESQKRPTFVVFGGGGGGDSGESGGGQSGEGSGNGNKGNSGGQGTGNGSNGNSGSCNGIIVINCNVKAPETPPKKEKQPDDGGGA